MQVKPNSVRLKSGPGGHAWETTTSGISHFRDLRVWQAGVDLVSRIYVASESFPRKEVFGLTGQIRRAAVSVPSNIAEGHTRQHTKEFLNHLSIAQASLAEVETQIEIAVRLRYLKLNEARELFTHIASIGKQLYALRNALLKHL